uniref:glycine-rich cell wall structural protein 2-like n=1 Tax=Lonchura striata TaxID=40157 RepID=UPI000B4CF5AF|nr:glycine-rich cell wall structural protein 2-like [Lonchura striata domestica]
MRGAHHVFRRLNQDGGRVCRPAGALWGWARTAGGCRGAGGGGVATQGPGVSPHGRGSGWGGRTGIPGASFRTSGIGGVATRPPGMGSGGKAAAASAGSSVCRNAAKPLSEGRSSSCGWGVRAAPLGSGTLCGQRYTLECHPKGARLEFRYTGTGIGSGTGVSPERHGTARLPVHGAGTGLGTGIWEPQVRRGGAGPCWRRRGEAGR